jgi:hypothetical protein
LGKFIKKISRRKEPEPLSRQTACSGQKENKTSKYVTKRFARQGKSAPQAASALF